MKPINEEQKQTLITECEEEIARLKRLRDDYNFPGSEDLFETYSNRLLRQEIALASLTSEPEYWQFMSASRNWIGIGKQGMEQAVSEGCEVRPLYTAPPVPVIKLPSVQDLIDEYKYQASPHDIRIWSFSLSVINRLNGLE